MHPGGVRSALHLFNFETSANLKRPNVQVKFIVYTVDSPWLRIPQGALIAQIHVDIWAHL